ncbi:uncharacterized protein GLRG_05982 [Colletotrichum graminicola M1.001]|uniref:Uncharacterized protein n=1 Tax=Colletotrichum graminicola (strain M1.001 / M2 / FGSC 10212) TaxID=645133 RepID=E3QJ00_COLGM|nr:uncharacterized protein GLRG_05982 [Colletotrichum graminicola M1.001]EFQ30838.1 hypothetical protein GLRG_05982 [Colletotrichum graminicola M1.001]
MVTASGLAKKGARLIGAHAHDGLPTTQGRSGGVRLKGQCGQMAAATVSNKIPCH